MANDTDKQIRMSLKDLIQDAYATARIWPYNALSHELGEWPGIFRTTDDKTHGWIIKRSSLAAEWKNAVKDRQSIDYDIFGFYGFRQGDETDNSDNEFGEICDVAYKALKASHDLGLEGIVERHDLLQYQRITTIACGEETLHFAQGRLRVHLCC